MSRPNQVRIMLVLAFLLTLVAGAVVGAGFVRSTTAIDQPPPPVVQPPPPSTTRPHPDWLLDRLAVTDPKQREQWNAIWQKSPRDKFKQIGEQEHACYQSRNEAIAALYTSEQRTEKDRIYQEFKTKFDKLMHDREKAIAAIYTPEQKAERERLEKECSTRVSELKAERDKLMQPLLAQTRAILTTDDQRRRFDGMFRLGQGMSPGPVPGIDRGHRNGPDRGGPDRGGLDRGGPGGMPMPPGGMPNRRSSSTQPSTRPVAAPSDQGKGRDREGVNVSQENSAHG